MSNVRRVYVEKKPDFAVKAKELKHEIKHYLGITTVEAVRVLIRYDVENISEETYKKALYTVFSEPPVDDIYEETFDYGDAKVFTVEFLPGQFDQRADSAEQCVKLLNENEEPIIRSAITYVIEVISQMSSLLLLRSIASTLLIRVLSAWKSLRHLCRSLMILLMSSYLTASRIWQRTS